MFYVLQRHIVVDTFFGYDEESMDSETSSVASFRMDRTPATPDEDMGEVRVRICRIAILLGPFCTEFANSFKPKKQAG